MTSIHTLYTRLKNIPIIGSFVRLLGKLYHHPRLAATRLLKRDRAAAHEALSVLYGAQSEAHQHLETFLASPAFSRSFSLGHSGDFDVMMLYALVRMQKPEVIIETGVASGRSSSVILAALRDNGKGRLYSIDLPQFYGGDTPERFTTTEGNQELRGFVPEGKQPGWLIPEALRDRWELILGDSNEELPKLLARTPIVDIFYHDGDHSYGTMHFEFESTWKQIPSGGLMLSDDIDWNDAWKDFVRDAAPEKNYAYRHFGIARKHIKSSSIAQ